MADPRPEDKIFIVFIASFACKECASANLQKIGVGLPERIEPRLVNRRVEKAELTCKFCLKDVAQGTPISWRVDEVSREAFSREDFVSLQSMN